MRDFDGNTMNLTTFEVLCEPGYGHLRWPGGSGDLYEWIKAIPLLQNRTFDANQVQGDAVALFVFWEKISDYSFDGNTATINLLSGDSLTGAPFINCTYSGESAVGPISAYPGDIQALKFNASNLQPLLDQHLSFEMLSEHFESKADVTLSTGETLPLENFAFVYNHRTLDTNWIPAISRHSWEREQVIPVQAGAFKTIVPFADIQSIEFNVANTPNNLTLNLRNGDQMGGTLYCDKNTFGGTGCSPVAFLGSADYGYVHIELSAIKTILFRDE
jgi:hypothetical protein